MEQDERGLAGDGRRSGGPSLHADPISPSRTVAVTGGASGNLTSTWPGKNCTGLLPRFRDNVQRGQDQIGRNEASVPRLVMVLPSLTSIRAMALWM